MTFKAAVFGLGKIGQGYDYDKINLAITHASGYNSHSKFELVAGVDIDKNKRLAFESKFKKPTFLNTTALMENLKPDVVSIAVPTEFHFKIHKEVIKYKPRAIICEKPLSNNLETAKLMVKNSKKNHSSLLINYQKRFDPAVKELKTLIDNRII